MPRPDVAVGTARSARRRAARFPAGLLLLLIAGGQISVGARADAGSPVAVENRLPGTGEWRLTAPAREREIEGYASATSVERGEAIDLYVSTAAPSYTIEVFRIGWYQSLGARRVAGPFAVAGHLQVTPPPDPATGLVDCAWTDPFTLRTGADWVSGVYLAKLTEQGQGRQSYVIFVVRDDVRAGGLLVQLPVTTYQAYNFWGGKSLYVRGSGEGLPWGSTSGRPATRVSFDRPYVASTNPAAAYGVGAGEFLTNLQPVAQGYPISSAGWDVNTVRWLEREGYDVAYDTSLDTHARPDALARAKAFLSIGHDEYWSWEMRQHVEAARDGGVGLGFFSSNTMYWQVRLESAPAGGAPDRVMVAHKKTDADPLAADPDPARRRLATVRWRDPPVDMPEAALIGVGYELDPVDGDIVPVATGHWVFDGAGLGAGDPLRGLLGYEVDGLLAGSPAGITVLAASPATSLDDPGQRVVANMTVYTAPGGALVFATGSMQWSWGLDDENAPTLRTSRLSPAAQQITRNVLARFLR